MPWHAAHELTLAYPAGAIAAILYGSLLPFRFSRAGLVDFNILALWDAGLRATTFADIVTNILVYVPIGALLVLARWGSGWHPGLRTAIVLLFGTILSMVAETLQSAIPERVTSSTDVFLNMTGTVIGAALALLLRANRFRVENILLAGARQPCLAASILLTVGLVGYELAPFDFIASTVELHASFLGAHWDLFTPRPIGLDVLPLTPLGHQLAGAAWFALLAVLTVFARARDECEPSDVFASAVKHSVLLAGIIEMLQLFTHSYACDVGTIVLRSLAAALGAWAAAVVCANRGDHKLDFRSTPSIRAGFFATLLLIQLALMLAGVERGTPVGFLNPTTWEFSALPFEALWRSSLPASTADLLADLVAYATFAATAALWLGWRGHVVLGTVVVTTITALLMVVIRAAGNGAIDLTPVIIAIGCSAVVARTTLALAGLVSTHASAPQHEMVRHTNESSVGSTTVIDVPGA